MSSLKPPGDLIDIGGRRLHCVRAGTGGPTVVLESGGGGGSSPQDWPVLNLVAPITRCLAYDRAGLGWSDPAAEPRTYDGMARDLEALLTAAGEPPPFVLVGASFGGLLVRAYARLHPDKVAGMVLVDAAEEEKYFSTMPAMREVHDEELRSNADRARRGELRAEIEPVLRRGPFDAPTTAAILHILGLGGHFEASLLELQAIDRVPERDRGAGALGDLGDRPLVVVSHGKPYVGATAVWEDGWDDAQRRLAALSTRGQHIIAATNGHSIALENPRLVAACIAAVVGAVRGGPLDLTEARQLTAGR